MADNTVNTTAVATGTSQSKSRMLGIGVVILALSVMGVAFWAYNETRTAEKKLEENLELRAGVIVDGRVDAIDTQLKSMNAAGSRVVESEIFRFFAAEVDQVGDVSLRVAPPAGQTPPPFVPGESDADKLADRLPLMVGYLRDFVVAEGFVTGHIASKKGEIYISTLPTPPKLSTDILNAVKAVLATGKAFVSPIYTDNTGLVHNIMLPMFPPEFENPTVPPVSVLILVKAVTGKNSLSDIVSVSPVGTEGSVTHLVQETSAGFQEIVNIDIRRVEKPLGLANNKLPFGMRKSLDGAGNVYSMGSQVPGTSWWIIQEKNYAASREEYKSTVTNIIGLAVLAALVIALLLGVIWWRIVGQEQEKIAGHLRDLCAVIETQKKFLGAINGTMTDPLALVDLKGIFLYVNEAFGKAVNRPAEDVLSLDMVAIFGFDTAKRLGQSDKKVLDTGESVTTDEIIWLQSKRHHFQINKAPLRGDDSAITGIVSVFRDITKQVEAQERGSRMVQQTIDALVRAIEATDPFLGGHSRIMGRVAVLIARMLNLPERDVSTIETAASLSQIGKMFVPREILTKPGALTDEEKKLMEQHVEYSREMLKNIEFELPVVPAVYQMNERLDGNGYPQQLSGDAISMEARILSVANAFTAMARPRSYRAAMPVDEVLQVLLRQAGAYDQAVVTALAEVLKTPQGEKLATMAASSVAV